MKKQEWNGPANTIERLEWASRGCPDYATWLRIKWGKRR